MEMKLCTVIYSGKVAIDDVPVYSCPECQHSEVLPEVKPELAGLIRTLGSNPQKQHISFGDVHELAHLMKMLPNRDPLHASFQAVVEERVNELLDLLLLAKQLRDELWKQEVLQKLEQVSRLLQTT
jgi:hypothetical protein